VFVPAATQEGGGDWLSDLFVVMWWFGGLALSLCCECGVCWLGVCVARRLERSCLLSRLSSFGAQSCKVVFLPSPMPLFRNVLYYSIYVYLLSDIAAKFLSPQKQVLNKVLNAI
jgi:hypothetical protein